MISLFLSIAPGKGGVERWMQTSQSLARNEQGMAVFSD